MASDGRPGVGRGRQVRCQAVRVIMSNLLKGYGSGGSACHGDLVALYASSFVSALQFDGPGVVLCCQGIDQCPV
jgi:hypothetical protein